MKVTIVKTHELDGSRWFKVIDEKNITKHFSFDLEVPEESYASEKNALNRAMKYAKVLESHDINFKPTEEIIYKTGKNIDPLAYFMAANMSDEEIQTTIGVDLSKIDEP